MPQTDFPLSWHQFTHVQLPGFRKQFIFMCTCTVELHNVKNSKKNGINMSEPSKSKLRTNIHYEKESSYTYAQVYHFFVIHPGEVWLHCLSIKIVTNNVTIETQPTLWTWNLVIHIPNKFINWLRPLETSQNIRKTLLKVWWSSFHFYVTNFWNVKLYDTV